MRWRCLRAATAMFGLLAILSACTEQQMRSGANAPDSVTLCLPGKNGWMPLEAEVAATPQARRQGLSGRERLSRRSGMLFLYPQTQGADNRFWMYRTNMPLTIAFLDEDGTIGALQGMSPCQEEDSDDCRRYRAGEPHRAALEVNQGLFDALEVDAGDRITRDPSPRGKCRKPATFSVEALLGGY